MYENKTYESILSEMLAKIPSGLDKSEGSVIWLALAPAALMIAQAFAAVEGIYKEISGDTASRENLINLAKDTKGLVPKAATAAVWYLSALPNDIDITGERFLCGHEVLYVTERSEDGRFIATCETAGAIGNTLSEDLLPIGYIKGLEAVSLSELLFAGSDEEDTEVFRKRWRQSFGTKEFGGNKAYYKAEIKLIQGVGGVKVYRAENAEGEKTGGHVRCVITSADNMPPSAELVSKVQEIIDPNGDGEGDGEACFGHTVHIEGAAEYELRIGIDITFESDGSFSDRYDEIMSNVNDYLSSVRSAWEDSENLVVRISQIENAILNVEGVLDVSGTMINGNDSNLILTTEYIPVLKEITEVSNE